jgi:hypothetical protein
VIGVYYGKKMPAGSRGQLFIKAKLGLDPNFENNFENHVIRCTITIMLTVIETPVYLVWAEKVWPKEGEREEVVNWLAANPDSGKVIEETGGIRKVRFARQGMGKQGGARVIYYLRARQGEVVLLLAYAKSKFDNLRPEFLRKLKEHYEDDE